MSVDTIKSERVPCFVDGTILIHKRSPVAAVDSDRSVVKQAACCHLFCLLAQWLGVTSSPSEALLSAAPEKKKTRVVPAKLATVIISQVRNISGPIIYM